MKKIFIALVLSVVAAFGGYTVGYTRGQNVALHQMALKESQSSGEVLLGNYIAARSIASNLRSGDVPAATCMARLRASSAYDDVRACIKDPVCGSSISNKVAALASELVNQQAPPFDYAPASNNIRSCSQ